MLFTSNRYLRQPVLGLPPDQPSLKYYISIEGIQYTTIFCTFIFCYLILIIIPALFSQPYCVMSYGQWYQTNATPSMEYHND